MGKNKTAKMSMIEVVSLVSKTGRHKFMSNRVIIRNGSCGFSKDMYPMIS